MDEATDTVAPEESKVVSLTHVTDVSLSDLQAMAAAFGLKDIKENLKYPISVDKLIYKTTYKGKIISASGLIYTPKAPGIPLPILSAHHGTTFKKSEAPSVSYGLSQEEFAASSGFIILVPDYIGYGASEDIFHPYYDEYHSAKAVTDMIKAGKEIMNKNKVQLNSKLFLFGYSEGGYVTLAAQKAIEAEQNFGLILTGVAAGAGGYDLSQMLSTVTSSSSYSYPAYLAFVIQSFNQTNDWNKPLSYFFADKYAEHLTLMLDGSYGGGQINSQLTTETASLLNSGFYENIKGNGELEFKKTLIKNSLVNWTPKTPLRLYHGTMDEIIPYQNSEQVYQKFKQAGSNVELNLISNGTHGSSFLPMIESVFPWFEELNRSN